MTDSAGPGFPRGEAERRLYPDPGPGKILPVQVASVRRMTISPNPERAAKEPFPAGHRLLLLRHPVEALAAEARVATLPGSAARAPQFPVHSAGPAAAHLP